MFDDIITKPKRVAEQNIRCRNCGNRDVKVSPREKTGIGFRPDNSIYTRYKVYVKCPTCNADYSITYIED